MQKLFVVLLLVAASSSSGQQTEGKKTSGHTCDLKPLPAGRTVKRVNPILPPGVTAKAIAEGVVLQLVIDKEGVPKDIKVRKGDPALAKAAVEAVRQWRYKPYKLNGEAVEVESTVYVTFDPAID